MKLVINSPKEDHEIVELSRINKLKVYVYMSVSGRVSLLSRLGYSYAKHDYGTYHYGFINLSKTNDYPTFKAKTAIESVNKAMGHGATVYEFNTFKEFIDWKYKLNN